MSEGAPWYQAHKSGRSEATSGGVEGPRRAKRDLGGPDGGARR
ncbi:MAG: hypothetical protein JWN44_4297, partial [Myxococcales bacterium]|nr:hypothetical protein [Myxococcales bacterium]